MIKILVSHCLLGENCKWNGRNNARDLIISLQDKVELIPVCAEVWGGLPTPRIPSEIVGDKVLNEIGLDVTKNYEEGAQKVLKVALDNHVKYAIFKERSPSCGVHQVYNGKFERTAIEGRGICTKLLEENGIKVYSDEEIQEIIKSLHQDSKND